MVLQLCQFFTNVGTAICSRARNHNLIALVCKVSEEVKVNLSWSQIARKN